MFWIIMYGTKVFRKKYGQKKEMCPICHNRTTSYFRTSTWVYFLLPIPLFPISFKYWKYCELCGAAQQYTKKQFFEELNKPEQELPPEDPIDLTKGSRQITLSRRARNGKGPALDVYVGNQLVAKLEKNQPSVTFKTDLKPRAIFVKLSNKNKVISDWMFLKEGSKDAEYQAQISFDMKDICLFEMD